MMKISLLVRRRLYIERVRPWWEKSNQVCSRKKILTFKAVFIRAPESSMPRRMHGRSILAFPRQYYIWWRLCNKRESIHNRKGSSHLRSLCLLCCKIWVNLYTTRKISWFILTKCEGGDLLETPIRLVIVNMVENIQSFYIYIYIPLNFFVIISLLRAFI